MDRSSRRWPLPKTTTEWVVGLPGMLLIAFLVFAVVAVGSRLAWLGWGLGIAFFTWLSDLTNRKTASMRTRVRYLLCVGAVVGFVLGMPFSR